MAVLGSSEGCTKGELSVLMELLLQPLAMQCAVCGEERGGRKFFVEFRDTKMGKRKTFCNGERFRCLQLKIVPLLCDGGGFEESYGLTHLESPTRPFRGGSHYSLRVLNVLNVVILKPPGEIGG